MEAARDSVDVVRHVYDLLRDCFENRGEPSADELEGLVAPGAPFTLSSALAAGTPGPYFGPDGVAQMIADVCARWRDFEVEVDEFREAPGAVVALGRVVASGEQGQGYAASHSAVWELAADGRIRAATAYDNQQRALEKAGLNG